MKPLLRRIALVVLLSWLTGSLVFAQDLSPTSEQRALLAGRQEDGTIALLYHVRIGERFAFDAWQSGVRERVEEAGGRRVYAGAPDPVSWDGMQVDAIWIDELPNATAALEALDQATSGATRAVESLSVIALEPVPRIVPMLLRWAGAVAHFIAPIRDTDTQASIEPRDVAFASGRSEIWSDGETLRVAREQDPSRPLFMYNLNKLRAQAAYAPGTEEDPEVSGEQAYRRYGSPGGLLRRGGYPFYIADFVGYVAGDESTPLADTWSQFILAYYPRRSEIFAMTASEDYVARRHHREAALERASLRFTTPWPSYDPTWSALAPASATTDP